MVENLYVHFPFCRRKCSYCALHSRAGSQQSERDCYAKAIAKTIDSNPDLSKALSPSLKSVYFGGGTPALCNLAPVLEVLRKRMGTDCEFTVELHPEDVCDELLETLAAGGVNRISMGVQSLSDTTLAEMGRGYSLAFAHHAFDCVKRVFDNAGIDLIVGYPSDLHRVRQRDVSALGEWGLAHCSVYSLQNERRLADVPSDDAILDGIRMFASALCDMGLERYEISNYAIPGKECSHNFAVWRGEDYAGVGDGAYGRIGLVRTRNFGTTNAALETMTEDFDAKERRLFSLRTRDGLDSSGFPQWRSTLDHHCRRGLVVRCENVYRLTERGMEVCDAILADLV